MTSSIRGRKTGKKNGSELFLSWTQPEMTSSIRKIAFLSPHCLVDFTNGAATATRDGLQLLADLGFKCSAFCGTRLDDPTEGLIQESLFRRKINYEVRKVRIPLLAPPTRLPTLSAKQTPSPQTHALSPCPSPAGYSGRGELRSPLDIPCRGQDRRHAL
jgi:hypothetical protein